MPTYKNGGMIAGNWYSRWYVLINFFENQLAIAWDTWTYDQDHDTSSSLLYMQLITMGMNMIIS